MNIGDDGNRLAAEARARVLIDRQLSGAGWSVHDSQIELITLNACGLCADWKGSHPL